MSELEDRRLPVVFINRFRKKNMIECQTLELVKLNQKITDAHNEVINMSDRSVQELIDDVRPEMHPLFKISESIAMLDMIASFAQLVTTQDYVKPELTDTLAIKAGRHPIRDKIQIEKYVPNDVYATQQTRFQIITGCNMSGKSTYIRAIALMTVMAQIGCFVPAQYASFPISHQLFARVSTDDNIEANVSTFAAEMREIAFILRNIERRSLVIIDELGRGTSTTDGLAIAIAIAEALIESRAYVWFVTHFRDLARILAERAGVVNMHLAVHISVNSSKMKMLYKIADGYEEEKFYGLALARVVDLPEDVIKTATRVSEALNRRNEARKSNAKVLSVARRRKLVLSLREHLIQAQDGSMEGEELRQWLKRLQDEFVVRMQAIEAEAATALEKELGDTTESDRNFESCAPADQEGQADQLSADHGTEFSPVAVDTCLSFATPQRPIKIERQSSVVAAVDEGHYSMVESGAGRQHSIVESVADRQPL
jgi:DNA mismatch repair protein MSH4